MPSKVQCTGGSRMVTASPDSQAAIGPTSGNCWWGHPAPLEGDLKEEGLLSRNHLSTVQAKLCW